MFPLDSGIKRGSIKGNIKVSGLLKEMVVSLLEWGVVKECFRGKRCFSFEPHWDWETGRDLGGNVFFFFLRFIYFWFCWVLTAVHRLSLVVATRSYSSLQCTGLLQCFSCCRTQAVGALASVVAAQGLSNCGPWALEHWLSSCGTWGLVLACGNFPDQGLNSWPLHWQADSQWVDHQGMGEEVVKAGIAQGGQHWMCKGCLTWVNLISPLTQPVLGRQQHDPSFKVFTMGDRQGNHEFWCGLLRSRREVHAG